MTRETYAELLSDLTLGKRLNNAVYLHLQALESCSNAIRGFVEEIRNHARVGSEYNVVKFSLFELRVSFLSYPDFFERPHPQLWSSISVNLATRKIRRHDYQRSHNPPILHRKETLLGPAHPLANEFKALTAEEEAEGLYSDTKIIGFKMNWESLLAAKGLSYAGHKLVRVQLQAAPKEEGAVEVLRHKTAIARYKFSRPIQTILEHDLLTEAVSLLDYGCGQGDDVNRLKEMGFAVSAWDPVYNPSGPKEPADIVNLGFVLNVIEDPAERTGVLHEAYELSKKLLVVSTLVASSSTPMMGRPYKDGILTNRNTFQKYFRQEELRQYIEDVLEIPPVAVGLGIFYVFRSIEEQQAFLSGRSRHEIDWLKISKRLQPSSIRSERRELAKRPPKPDLYALHQEILDAFWTRMLYLGRLPLPNEFERYDELHDTVGSPGRARALFIRRFGKDTLQNAFELRRNDLLVYIALSSFKKPVPFKHLPESIKADVKTFLGGYKKGSEEGVSLLFAAGNPEIITRLCDETSFGYLNKQALFIHRSLLPDLHPILRIYVGCAELLAGDLRGYDLIKLHKRSGKVTLLRYDNFEDHPLPELIERIKVSLKKQSVDIYDHASIERQELLYFKERYVALEHPDRVTWESFSVKLQELGLDLSTDFGPSKQELLAVLDASLISEFFPGTFF